MTVPVWQADLIGDLLDEITDQKVRQILIGAHLILEVQYGKGLEPNQENFSDMMADVIRNKAESYDSRFGTMLREYLEIDPEIINKAIAYLPQK